MRTIACCEQDRDHDGNCLRHKDPVQVATTFAPLVFTDRAGGKTNFLLGWLVNGPPDELRLLVCHDQNERKRLTGLIRERELPVDTSRVILWREALSGEALHGITRSMGRVVFGVDNLDLHLRQMFPAEVGVATLSTVPLETEESRQQRELVDRLVSERDFAQNALQVMREERDAAFDALQGWKAWEDAQAEYSAECERIEADATTMSMLAHYPARKHDRAVRLRKEVLGE